MATPTENAKSVEIGGSTAAFKSADNSAQIGSGRRSQKKVEVFRFAAKPGNSTTDAISSGSKNLANNGKVSKNPRELRAKDDVPTKRVDIVACYIKVKVPNSLRPVLDALVPKARVCVDRMLAHRDQSCSKFFHEVPIVIPKSLIAKYQRNKKCKSVTNRVLPICGDKGKQIKLEASGLRITALFKKEILPVIWLRLPVGFIRSAEFFMRHGEWYAAIYYNAKADKQFICTGTVGVDRNSVAAVATLADPQSGKVLRLGFNPAKTKEVWRGQKADLQSLGRLRHTIRNQQSTRTKYENRVVSKQIVDYAVKHRCINIEKLQNVRKGMIRRYSEESQWSFYQLLPFILYKAALRGVMVLEVDSADTSEECSRCHKLTRPNGKSYRCGQSGHNDHQDAYAAFNASQRVMPIGRVVRDSVRPDPLLLVAPFEGTEAQQCV